MIDWIDIKNHSGRGGFFVHKNRMFAFCEHEEDVNRIIVSDHNGLWFPVFKISRRRLLYWMSQIEFSYSRGLLSGETLTPFPYCVKIDSFTNFIQYIKTYLLLNEEIRLYRGQGNENWNLESGLFRKTRDKGSLKSFYDLEKIQLGNFFKTTSKL